MPHMIAQEHMGYVSALRYGTARNQATINAALAAIGGSIAWLVLDFTGDGVWTVTSNTGIQRLYLPMGVTVNVASGISLAVSQVIAGNSAWKTGAGTLTLGGGTTTQIAGFSCVTYNQQNSQGVTCWQLDGGTGDPAGIRMYLNNGGAGCGIAVSRNKDNVNSTWQLNAINSGSFQLTRPGTNPIMFINNNGVMLGANVEPSAYMLQLGSGDAAKPAGTTWQVTSDGRTKDIQGTFDHGLAALLALPLSVRFHFNGKAGTPVDGKEYVGMIAQDVQPIAPYMITTYQARLEPEDPEPTTIFAMDSSPLIFAVINALRELDTRLVALESSPRRRHTGEEPEEAPAPEKDAEAAPRRRKRAS